MFVSDEYYTVKCCWDGMQSPALVTKITMFSVTGGITRISFTLQLTLQPFVVSLIMPVAESKVLMGNTRRAVS